MGILNLTRGISAGQCQLHYSRAVSLEVWGGPIVSGDNDMSRSLSAPHLGAALQAGNVIYLWPRTGCAIRQRASISLISNLVSALCAPFEGACAQTRDNIVSVPGTGPLGIDICVCVNEHSCSLRLGGWHDEMPDVNLALEYIARAINGRLRLKVTCAPGYRPRKWSVECLAADGTWIEEAFTCDVRMWWYRPETTIYLRNSYRPARTVGYREPAA